MNDRRAQKQETKSVTAKPCRASIDRSPCLLAPEPHHEWPRTPAAPLREHRVRRRRRGLAKHRRAAHGDRPGLRPNSRPQPGRNRRTAVGRSRARPGSRTRPDRWQPRYSNRPRAKLSGPSRRAPGRSSKCSTHTPSACLRLSNLVRPTILHPLRDYRSQRAGNVSPPATVERASNTLGWIVACRNRTDPSAMATITPSRCSPPN